MTNINHFEEEKINNYITEVVPEYKYQGQTISSEDKIEK